MPEKPPDSSATARPAYPGSAEHAVARPHRPGAMPPHRRRRWIPGRRAALPEFICRDYFPSLDGLRALAIASVIVSHLVGVEEQTFPFFGIWGVNFFFVLSGFLITTLLVKEHARRGRISLGNFYVRRALRILPLAILFLMAMGAFNSLYGLGIAPAGFATAALYVSNLPIAVPGNDWYLAHFWSLGAEEQFYLVGPALLCLGARTFMRCAVLLILAAYVSIFLFFHIWRASPLLGYVQAVLGPQIPLLIGSLTALLLCKRDLVLRPFGSAASIALLAASLIFQSGYVPLIPRLFGGTLAALCFAALIVSGIQDNQSRFFRAVNTPAIRKVGVLSYSLYIWQQIFTREQFLFVRPDDAALTVGVNLAMLALFSLASHYFVERYFLRFKSRFVPV